MPIHPVYRVTVFVPPDHVDSLLQAIEREDPLVFGPYDSSAWWSAPGVEQFRPLPGAAPTVGEVGRTERVSTVRLEFALPRVPEVLERILACLLLNHPWQEPAVFVDESHSSATHLRQ